VELRPTTVKCNLILFYSFYRFLLPNTKLCTVCRIFFLPERVGLHCCSMIEEGLREGFLQALNSSPKVIEIEDVLIEK
jgi:hypothetical protein